MHPSIKIAPFCLLSIFAPDYALAETTFFKFRTGELLTDLSHPDPAVQKVLNDNRNKLAAAYGPPSNGPEGLFGEILLEIDCGASGCLNAGFSILDLERPSVSLIPPIVSYSSSSTLSPDTFSDFYVSIDAARGISGWSIRSTEYGQGGGWDLNSSVASWKESASGNYQLFQTDYCGEIGTSFDAELGFHVCENGSEIPELEFFDGYNWTFEYAPGSWEIVPNPNSPQLSAVPLPGGLIFLATGVSMCGWAAKRRKPGRFMRSDLCPQSGNQDDI